MFSFSGAATSTDIQLTFVPLSQQEGVMASTQRTFETVKEVIAAVHNLATADDKIADDKTPGQRAMMRWLPRL